MRRVERMPAWRPLEMGKPALRSPQRRGNGRGLPLPWWASCAVPKQLLVVSKHLLYSPRATKAPLPYPPLRQWTVRPRHVSKRPPVEHHAIVGEQQGHGVRNPVSRTPGRIEASRQVPGRARNGRCAPVVGHGAEPTGHQPVGCGRVGHVQYPVVPRLAVGVLVHVRHDLEGRAGVGRPQADHVPRLDGPVVGLVVVGVEVQAHGELEPGQELNGVVPLAEALGAVQQPHETGLKVAWCAHLLGYERPICRKVLPVHDNGERDEHFQVHGKVEQQGRASWNRIPRDLGVPHGLGRPALPAGHQEQLLDAEAGEHHVRVHLCDVVCLGVQIRPMEAPHRAHHTLLH
mmetsp:Transcript_69894/g.216116  ORF Transcript_69894/g.216116 Transcript_69894/m.216116 type:complete len:345 (+) Transcript_69894:10-1044(+)